MEGEEIRLKRRRAGGRAGPRAADDLVSWVGGLGRLVVVYRSGSYVSDEAARQG